MQGKSFYRVGIPGYFTLPVMVRCRITDIGTVEMNFRTITELPRLPGRPSDSHKGTYGTAIVIGGSSTMPGAPAICARAALRAGVGLVKVAAYPQVLSTIIAIEPGATGIELVGELDNKLAAIDRADRDKRGVLAVGPGMGTTPEAQSMVLALLQGSRTMVLDADGLNVLAASNRRHTDKGCPLVLTPHPGEFKRLAEPLRLHANPTDAGARIDAAAALAQAHHAVVVLKGRQTVVSDGACVYINTTGNPSLATAGSGDVLTGVIAALIAQGMTLINAAVMGVYLHGLAADHWAASHGRAGLLARDLADQLPDVMQGIRMGAGGE